jgi:hypothetical protein
MAFPNHPELRSTLDPTFNSAADHNSAPNRKRMMQPYKTLQNTMPFGGQATAGLDLSAELVASL